MSHTFTRRELFDLVWSEPMRTLAKRFNLSDVSLVKACKKANIPRPPRGYWVRRAAGKKVVTAVLSNRGPGMSDEIEVGAGRYGYYRSCSEEEILSADPKPPVFEEDIAEVAERASKMVRRVTVPRFPDRAHRQIRKLLDADEERRQYQLKRGYASVWNAPLFDDAVEKRRLRILNAKMTALEIAGMRPSVSGRYARDLSVRINDTIVGYKLDATSQKPNRFGEISIDTRGPSKKLRLAISENESSEEIRLVWEDTDTERLESSLTEIVRALIVAGERQYHANQNWRYERLLERKARLIEEIRIRKEEEERKVRERLAALEKARIDRLLGNAAAFRQAADIRAFVADVLTHHEAGDVPVSQHELEDWRTWALVQADRIDPVRSGRLIESVRDVELVVLEGQ